MNNLIKDLLVDLNNAFNQEYPKTVWIDGFCDCLLHGHSSHDSDNPHDQRSEREKYKEYKDGAKAAEQLLGYLP
jgi:hypothetical protein